MLCALLLVVPGHGQGASDDEDPTAQLSKLQSLMFAYADKYMSAIGQVTDEALELDPANPELRLQLHDLKLLVAASVQALAVSANPESTLLDMMVFATLHRMVNEEDWARKLYGDGIERIVFGMRLLEKEIWGIASGYLNEKQIIDGRFSLGTELLRQLFYRCSKSFQGPGHALGLLERLPELGLDRHLVENLFHLPLDNKG